MTISCERSRSAVLNVDNNEIALSPAQLLTVAVEKGADVGSLEKLMDLQERWENRQAKKDFDAALSQFQAVCPTIIRNKEVKFGNTKWSYAELDSIREQIRESLQECGFSFRWSISDRTMETVDGKADSIQVNCILTHVGGHSEDNSMTATEDTSGSKNSVQSRGSTVTYLQRYTLIGVLGLTSANQDDDGMGSGGFDLVQYNALVRELFISIYVIKQGIKDEDLSIAVEAMSELTKEEKDTIWKAPTKGGIFTTEERNVMRSKEWREARAAIGDFDEV